MKIVFTGGHFSPALSLIENLTEDNILVIGRKYNFEGDDSTSLEYRVCSKKNIPFRAIRAGRFQRNFSRYTIPSMLKIPLGIVDSYNILKRFRPDVVVVFGGYIALAVAVSAFVLGIPVVIHEQTQKAGIANRIISFFAKRVCISFPSSAKFFPESKTILSGNPLRKEVFEIKDKIDTQSTFKIIYITGGSSGSHFINEMVRSNINKLLSEFTIIHQTGDSDVFHDYEDLEKIRNDLPDNLQKRYVLRKFIDLSEIGWVMQNADLIVGRSGINTICEIIVLKKVAFLIPLPHGQSGEQLDNARLIKKIGLGEYELQKNLTSETFLSKITEIIKNKKNYLINLQGLEFIDKNAQNKIIEVIKEVVSAKNT